MRLILVNPIWCRAIGNDQEMALIRSALSYKEQVWVRGKHHLESKIIIKSMLSRHGFFLQGLLPRVKNILDNQKISYQVSPTEERISPSSTHNFSFPELYPEQKEAVQAILDYQRGIIHFPTGSGKTLIMINAISHFFGLPTLVIIHRQDLVRQTYEVASQTFKDKVGIIGGGLFEPNLITISTIQTLYQRIPIDLLSTQKIVVVDEAHHITSINGMYYQILTKIPAPIRLGFTATIPTATKQRLILEGLLGPIIAQKHPSDINHLAKVRLILKKLPKQDELRQLRTWKDVYQNGIINNSIRNNTILSDAYNLCKNYGKTVLILIVNILHGQQLLELAHKKYPDMKIEFVWGGTEIEQRQRIKHLLEAGQTEVIIANVVWREGIDIPSLGAIINGAGGKSEIMTLQSIGRGLRTTPDKKEIIVVDYFDPSHPYLISHFGERVTLYFEENWIGGSL